jgi:hypothetical protein
VRSSSRECLRSVMRSMPITRAKTIRTAKKAMPHVRWQHRRPCSVIDGETLYPQVERYRRSRHIALTWVKRSVPATGCASMPAGRRGAR